MNIGIPGKQSLFDWHDFGSQCCDATSMSTEHQRYRLSCNNNQREGGCGLVTDYDAPSLHLARVACCPVPKCIKIMNISTLLNSFRLKVIFQKNSKRNNWFTKAIKTKKKKSQANWEIKDIKNRNRFGKNDKDKKRERVITTLTVVKMFILELFLQN